MRVGSIQNTDQVNIIISAMRDLHDIMAWKRQVHWLGPAKDNSMFAFSFDHSGKVSSFASRYNTATFRQLANMTLVSAQWVCICENAEFSSHRQQKLRHSKRAGIANLHCGTAVMVSAWANSKGVPLG
jgi:hypothetical protein